MQPKRDLSIKIDWEGLWSSIKDHWRYYCITVPITLVIAIIYAYSQIDLYTCKIKLAPETGDNQAKPMYSILSLFNKTKKSSKKGGITIELYPDLVRSLRFRVGLLPISLHRPGKEDVTYYEYLLNEQKKIWWNKLMQDDVIFTPKPADLFRPTGEQMIATGIMSSRISCEFDPKTYVITICVQDQDPLIAAQVADSVSTHLQQAIIEYKSSKAKVDYDHIKKIRQQAKEKYEESYNDYTRFSDANREIQLESSLSKQRMLEEEMQMNFKIYSELSAQLISAGAKIQEAAPAFTTLQSATVPLRPSEPNRLEIVFLSSIIAALLTTFFVWYKEGDLYRLIAGGYKHERK